MQNLKLSAKNLIIFLFLFIFSVRPLIDLQGSYTGDSINLGGVVGVLSVILAMVAIIISSSARKILAEPFFLWLAPVVFVSVLFSMASDDVDSTRVIFARFLSGFSFVVPMYMILSSGVPRRYLHFAYKFFLFSVSIPVAIGWLQYVGLYPYSFFDYYDGQSVGRVSGGYFQPSSLTRYLMFLIFFTLCLSKIKLVGGRLSFLIVAVSVATIFITGHRTSILLTLFLTPLFYYGVYSKFPMPNKSLIFFLLPAMPFVAVVVLMVNPDKILSLMDSLSITYNTIVNSFSLAFDGSFMRGRGNLWMMAVDTIQSSDLFNLLFGYSYTEFEIHNDPLRLIVTYGLFGFSCFSFFFYGLYRFCLRKIVTDNDVALISVYALLLLTSITLEPTLYPNFMWLFFVSLVFINLACGGNVLSQREVALSGRGK